MASIITTHNQQVLCPAEENYSCHCRVRTDFPMQNKCLMPEGIYETEVTNRTGEELKFYYGLTKEPKP